jgi:acetylornithine/N-succinyldiaminopimelate aminotransferase
MNTHVLPVYARSNLLFTRGEGAYLYTEKGDKYLDFAAGIAVNSLGHCHPHVVREVQDQVGKLWHTSNLYQIDGLERLAERLAKASEFAEYIFFCNSGAEAVEGAIKIARNYFYRTGKPERNEIITFDGAFHGRTIATISAANKPKLTEGFAPLAPGFKQGIFNNLDSVSALIDDKTAAIMLEVVQGEGGIRPAEPDFLHGVKALCKAHGLLLIYDAVQCGMGRTGKFFSHMHYGNCEPDILATAKGIGAGFPLGATFCTKEVGDKMPAGSHGTTYGGNPLAARVGNSVLDVMLQNGFLENVTEMGAKLINEIRELSKKFPNTIKGVRGVGLMIGIQINKEPRDFVIGLRDHKLLTAPASENIVRLLPPLIIDQIHIKQAVDSLYNYCKTL